MDFSPSTQYTYHNLAQQSWLVTLLMVHTNRQRKNFIFFREKSINGIVWPLKSKTLGRKHVATNLGNIKAGMALMIGCYVIEKISNQYKNLDIPDDFEHLLISALHNAMILIYRRVQTNIICQLLGPGFSRKYSTIKRAAFEMDYPVPWVPYHPTHQSYTLDLNPDPPILLIHQEYPIII